MNKITVSSKDLLKALKQTKPALATPSNGLYGFYRYYVFESVGKDVLTVKAADGMWWSITRSIDATIESSEPILFAVYGSYLYRILRLLLDEEITILCYDSQVEITHQTGSFFLPVEKREPEINVIELDKYKITRFEVPVLRRCLELTTEVEAEDFLRPILNGVCFDFQDKTPNIIATDGHVLSSIKVTSGCHTEHTDGSFVMPKEIAFSLQKILPKAGWCRILTNENEILVFVTDDTGIDRITIKGKTIDGKFPNWRNVIPSHFEMSAKVNRKDFIMAVKRTAVFAPPSNLLKCSLKTGEDFMSVSSKDGDFEHGATEHVSVEFDSLPSGNADYEIGFSWKSLQRITKHLSGETIILNMNNTNGACTISQDSREADDATFLIMPMYIGK